MTDAEIIFQALATIAREGASQVPGDYESSWKDSTGNAIAYKIDDVAVEDPDDLPEPVAAGWRAVSASLAAQLGAMGYRLERAQ